MKKNEERVRPGQGAKYIGVSRRTFHDYLKRGLIPYYKLSPRAVVVNLSDLDAFLESRRVG